MARYTKRIQAVLTGEQYEQIQRIARQRHKPISLLVREAVQREYLGTSTVEARRAALERLFALDAPVAEWDQMERSIAAGASEKPTPRKGRRG
jgi:hypothetical protein